jgi:hypothetical protein
VYDYTEAEIDALPESIVRRYHWLRGAIDRDDLRQTAELRLLLWKRENPPAGGFYNGRGAVRAIRKGLAVELNKSRRWGREPELPKTNADGDELKLDAIIACTTAVIDRDRDKGLLKVAGVIRAALTEVEWELLTRVACWAQALRGTPEWKRLVVLHGGRLGLDAKAAVRAEGLAVRKARRAADEAFDEFLASRKRRLDAEVN